MPEVAYQLIARGAKKKLEENAVARDEWFAEIRKAAAKALKTRKKQDLIATNETSGVRMIGIVAPTRKAKSWSGRVVDKPYAPDGWRLIEQTRYPGGPTYIVPKRNTKAGKELFANLHIDETFPSVLQLFGGMPHRIMVPERPHHWLSPGWTYVDGKLYVTWGGDPERDTFMKKQDDPGPVVDPKIWKRIPLSQYYKATEKQTAAAS